MKIAVIGSRNVIVVDIGNYISNAEEIVSGGEFKYCSALSL